jgi:hypothetical protein
LAVCVALWFFFQSYSFRVLHVSTTICGIEAASTFLHLAEHCAGASPISSAEFYQRQKSLARVLHSLNALAYIAEPGATAQFFGNISSNQWHLSERPLLLMVSPHLVNNDEIEATIHILTPSFEATRVKLLPIPSASDIVFAEWPEDVNPYEVAVSVLPPHVEGNGTIFVDGSIRHFIVDGLVGAASRSKVLSAPMEIRYLRERKSPAEIELMKCANEAGYFLCKYWSVTCACSSLVGAGDSTGYPCGEGEDVYWHTGIASPPHDVKRPFRSWPARSVSSSAFWR